MRSARSPCPRVPFSASLLSLVLHLSRPPPPPNSAAARAGHGRIRCRRAIRSTAIHFAKDKLSGFAVGYGQHDPSTRRTADLRGSDRRLPLDLTLSSVYVKDKKNAVIVGARGGIFTTDNGGTNWRTARSRCERSSLLRDICRRDTGWATGTYGRILKTTDGGVTWIDAVRRNRRASREGLGARYARLP